MLIFLTQNCSLEKVIKRHGINNLEKKVSKLEIGQTNKNNIFEILGPPSTKSLIDENILIYIERATSSSKLTKLGGKTLITNNVLLLKLDSRGLLIQKDFFDKNDLKKIDFSKNITDKNYSDDKDVVYNVLSSLRQKINDPLGKKRAISKND